MCNARGATGFDEARVFTRSIGSAPPKRCQCETSRTQQWQHEEHTLGFNNVITVHVWLSNTHTRTLWPHWQKSLSIIFFFFNCICDILIKGLVWMDLNINEPKMNGRFFFFCCGITFYSTQHMKESLCVFFVFFSSPHTAPSIPKWLPISPLHYTRWLLPCLFTEIHTLGLGGNKFP